MFNLCLNIERQGTLICNYCKKKKTEKFMGETEIESEKEKI
jgi:hypothetical protein